MAKGKFKKRVEVVEVRLKLSGPEWNALCAVLGAVGGDPCQSRRGLIDRIVEAVDYEGWYEFHMENNRDPASDLEGTLTFRDGGVS